MLVLAKSIYVSGFQFFHLELALPSIALKRKNEFQGCLEFGFLLKIDVSHELDKIQNWNVFSKLINKYFSII